MPALAQAPIPVTAHDRHMASAHSRASPSDAVALLMAEVDGALFPSITGLVECLIDRQAAAAERAGGTDA